MSSHDLDDRKEDVKQELNDRKEDVKQELMAMTSDDRKEDVKRELINDRIHEFTSPCTVVYPAPKRARRDDEWVWAEWQPQDRPLSLDEYLLANNGGTVSGLLECRRCKVLQTVEFDIVAAFNELRDELVAHRGHIQGPEFGFGAHGKEIQGAEFARTSCAKSVCHSCGKRSMWPVMPELEHLVETKIQYIMRNVDDMNMLFLLLGKFLRFCTVEELHVIWLCLGSPFPPTQIPSKALPHGMGPKQAYLIALHYRFARILDPNNANLDLGSWPFRSIFD